MARTPATMQYGVDEVPPAPVIVVTALQYVAVLSAFLVYKLVMRASFGCGSITE